MAEPTNTPVPASTPRSSSPVGLGGGHHPNAPIIPITSLPTSPLAAAFAPPRRRVLHIGDPVRYNLGTYAQFSAQCEIIRPEAHERERTAFLQALREKRWGDFHAIFRPFWGTGGEMGRWDAELIDVLPSTVKVFASAGAGFDWADTKLLGERGIVYCNSGLAAAEAVADFAIAMIISTFRVLPWCISAASSGDTAEFQDCHENATTRSHNLRGHKVGLIGLGRIGQQIAKRCRFGFGMDIWYYDVAEMPKSVTESLEAKTCASLEELVGSVDVVVLCAPAIPGATSALIAARELGCFRDGARFVNVARGSLVDEEAVADALDSGKLSSVALDVHPREPGISERLREHAKTGRAMLTCHNAGGTVETHIGFEELSMRNVMAVLGGQMAITPVNMQYLR
ncbi:uncharacterized protein F5Z01DRAFT_236254 [Emericellopsis atlantica]|uniref:D-mandelate dehydrogenase n=1 Tax=Emericellopsis atlantica TaxID=2614577 RepID=A0A9P8CMK3_9HYPO|nr:uncharacterized protein F5Z01DRAFT_236254 [Emericellopsis atlantica]KAG9252207.1 hypothetical protein F5Z01DRAFT_236254 [Emericellopsis atlantica]